MKKRLFLIILAVLLMVGSAYAISIPQSEDASNGPAIWLVQVYNNDTATVAAGDVLVWEISESTGDNDNYVNVTSTADTQLVAGVVWPSAIAAGAKGTMAVRGVVDCDINAGGVASLGTICTSTTEGEGGRCLDDNAAYAIATAANIGATTGKCMVIVQ